MEKVKSFLKKMSRSFLHESQKRGKRLFLCFASYVPAGRHRACIAT